MTINATPNIVMNVGSGGVLEHVPSVSLLITGFSVDMSTVKNFSPGSDNWPMTWASDGHQYTSWGDGGGFGGTDTNGRVSWGFGRVEGDFATQSGHNVNGGYLPENAATLPAGKSHGVLALEGNIWMWRSGNGSGSSGYNLEHLYKSTDSGATWTLTSAQWNKTDTPAKGFSNLSFIQYGQNMSAAPAHAGQYVYCLGFDEIDGLWNVQIPGKLILMRCPKTDMATKASWEWFNGTPGTESWTSDYSSRAPVFTDNTNGLMRLSCIYNPKLARYILITQQTDVNHGSGASMGWYQAEFPWGPWSAIGTTPVDPWATGTNGFIANDTKTVFWNISPKWSFLNANGTDFVLVGTFPGRDEYGAAQGSLTI